MSRHLPLVLLLAASACALTRNAPPLEVRYFAPELATPTGAPAPATPATAVPLRLGVIEHPDVLGHRIVQRTSSVELSLYETRRWTERPDEYVRRALIAALFDGGRFTRALVGTAPTLDIELVAFEEVQAPRHVGRVQLRYILHDRRTVLASGELVAEHAVTGEEFDAVVRAVAAANRDVAARVAEVAQRQLCGTAPAQ